jgi:hypothetical protein
MLIKYYTGLCGLSRIFFKIGNFTEKIPLSSLLSQANAVFSFLKVNKVSGIIAKRLRDFSDNKGNYYAKVFSFFDNVFVSDRPCG